MRYKSLAAALLIALAASMTVHADPAMADSFRNDQWYLKTMRIGQAHALSKGAGITVAVVDTGTYPHPDLRRNLLKGTSFVAREPSDGRTDRAGHGTEMAALVAGHGRGADGIIGIAPAAKILPIKITNAENSVPSTEMADAIEWAMAEHADVINISAAIGPSFQVQDAVRAAIEADIIIVASVGNTSSSQLVGYPAAMDGVLAVGAVSKSGKHAPLSLKTPKVAICTAGVDITTAEPRNKYIDVGGTSPAAAIASGAAALIRAKYPQLSAQDVIHRLTATADDIGPPGRDNECGFGRLNIVKALTADVPPIDGPTASATASPTSAAATTSPAATPTATSQAAPETEPADSNSTLIYGGLAGLVVAAAAALFVALRRRQRP